MRNNVHRFTRPLTEITEDFVWASNFIIREALRLRSMYLYKYWSTETPFVEGSGIGLSDGTDWRIFVCPSNFNIVCGLQFSDGFETTTTHAVHHGFWCVQYHIPTKDPYYWLYPVSSQRLCTKKCRVLDQRDKGTIMLRRIQQCRIYFCPPIFLENRQVSFSCRARQLW